MRSRMMLIVAFAASVSGCATWKIRQKLPVLPPTEAPLIVMNNVSTSRIMPVSSTAALPEVEVLDHRPGPERYYYPGSLEPRRWLDGMSMVPMEAFDPAIDEQIRAHCLASVTRNDLSAVSIQLTSFQVVFDQRQKLKHESSIFAQLWISRKEEAFYEQVERRRLSEKDFHDEHRSMMRRLRKDAGILGTPISSETPYFIATGKREGLNCRIAGNVYLTFRSDAKEDWPVETVLHQPVYEGANVQFQIANLVDKAVRQFCHSAIAE